MRANAKAKVMTATAVILAACGGGSGSSTQQDALAIDQAAQQIAAATASYGTAAASMPDHAACSADLGSYEAQVGPPMQRMSSRCAGMDAFMSSMGHGAQADLTCGVDAMEAELAHHRSVACASQTDMGPNQAEAARHVEAMAMWADHQRARAGEAGSMMGMSGMMGGTTGTCHRNDDGTYTLVGGAAAAAR